MVVGGDIPLAVLHPLIFYGMWGKIVHLFKILWASFYPLQQIMGNKIYHFTTHLFIIILKYLSEISYKLYSLSKEIKNYTYYKGCSFLAIYVSGWPKHSCMLSRAFMYLIRR